MGTSADKRLGKPLTWMIKNIGPMTGSWGTPLIASAIYDRVPLTFT